MSKFKILKQDDVYKLYGYNNRFILNTFSSARYIKLIKVNYRDGNIVSGIYLYKVFK